MTEFELAGVLLLRRAIAVEKTSALRANAERAFEAREARAAAGLLTGELQTPFVRRFVSLDDLASLDDLLPAAVVRIARAYLGHEPAATSDRYVREIRPERADTHLPFHQDQSILGRPCVNVWFPLTSCGVESPGLEFVRFSNHCLLAPQPRAGAAYAVEKVRLDEGLVKRTFEPSFFWRPAVEPGDALVFTGATIHRTFGSCEMTKSRMSAEIRLI